MKGTETRTRTDLRAVVDALDELLVQAVPQVAPALVCLVQRVTPEGTETLYRRAVGTLAPTLPQRKVTPETLFDLASLTKLFTATAFLRLVDRGLVTLDAPVTRVVPEFAGTRPIAGAEDPLAKTPIPPDPRWAGLTVDADTVTFRHLLTHTSGLPAWRSVHLRCGPPPAFPLSDQAIARRQARALEAVVAYPFVYPPGRGYAYSDIGFILLGFAVERLSGRRLDRAIRELVAEPLGCDPMFNPPPERWPDCAPTELCAWRGERLQGQVHDENAAGMGGIAGHAGLFATAEDVARLGRLYLSGGGSLLGAALAQESVAEQVRTPEGIRRGLGWMLRSEPEPSCSRAFSAQSFGHTGFTGTSLWCDPVSGLVGVLLTNRVVHGRDPARIQALRPAVYRLMGQMGPARGSLPSETTPPPS